MSGQQPFQQPTASLSSYSAMVFIIQQWINKIATVTPVKVMAVNPGAVGPVGTVDVQPLVNLVNGAGQPVPHGTIFKVPYFRLQGGTSAVILDPKVGDLGLAAFAMRDISSVKAAKDVANPASGRVYNYADALYFGGFLNGTPEQYVQFADSGITVVSPQKITLQAPTVEIDASTALNITSPASTINGPLHVTDAITADGDVTGEGTSLHTHVHSGVQAGGSDTGPPV